MTDPANSRLKERGYGGPVDSDVSYCRDGPGLLFFEVRPGILCHQCHSGEVYSPLQTCAPPHILTCLRCGTTDTATAFKHTNRTND